MALHQKKANELFRQIAHSGEHLLYVVNDILNFSRIEARRLVLEVKPFELKAVIDDVVSMIAKDVDDKGLALSNSDNTAPDFLPGIDIADGRPGEATR